jgi:hypothetical protein
MSATITTSPDIQRLSDQVHSLAERVAKLENHDTLLSPQDRETWPATHERVKQFTECIFGGRASIEPSSDPETDAKYFVVNVDASGEVAEILRLNGEWHRRLDEPAGKLAFLYRLFLNIP